MRWGPGRGRDVPRLSASNVPACVATAHLWVFLVKVLVHALVRLHERLADLLELGHDRHGPAHASQGAPLCSEAPDGREDGQHDDGVVAADLDGRGDKSARDGAGAEGAETGVGVAEVGQAHDRDVDGPRPEEDDDDGRQDGHHARQQVQHKLRGQMGWSLGREAQGRQAVHGRQGSARRTG